MSDQDMFTDDFEVTQPEQVVEQPKDEFEIPTDNIEEQQNIEQTEEQTTFEEPVNQTEEIIPEQPKEISPLRKFEIQREKELEERAKENKKKYQEKLEAAAAYIENQKKERLSRIELKHSTNIEHEKLFKQSMDEEHDNIWESVMKYIDINRDQSKAPVKKSKKKDEDVKVEPPIPSKDTSRLKKLLIQLKNEKPRE